MNEVYVYKVCVPVLRKAPVLTKVLARITAKSARLSQRVSAFDYLAQIPLADVDTMPGAAVERWRKKLIAEAVIYERNAAQNRKLAAMDPKDE